MRTVVRNVVYSFFMEVEESLLAYLLCDVVYGFDTLHAKLVDKQDASDEATINACERILIAKRQALSESINEVNEYEHCITLNDLKDFLKDYWQAPNNFNLTVKQMVMLSESSLVRGNAKHDLRNAVALLDALSLVELFVYASHQCNVFAVASAVGIDQVVTIQERFKHIGKQIRLLLEEEGQLSSCEDKVLVKWKS